MSTLEPDPLTCNGRRIAWLGNLVLSPSTEWLKIPELPCDLTDPDFFMYMGTEWRTGLQLVTTEDINEIWFPLPISMGPPATPVLRSLTSAQHGAFNFCLRYILGVYVCMHVRVWSHLLLFLVRLPARSLIWLITLPLFSDSLWAVGGGCCCHQQNPAQVLCIVTIVSMVTIYSGSFSLLKQPLHDTFKLRSQGHTEVQRCWLIFPWRGQEIFVRDPGP